MKRLEAVITLTLVIRFDEPVEGTWEAAALQAMNRALDYARGEYEDVVEPHVDAIEEVQA